MNEQGERDENCCLEACEGDLCSCSHADCPCCHQDCKDSADAEVAS